MLRGIRIAFVIASVGALGSAAGAAVGANGDATKASTGSGGLRLVATATKSGLLVRAIGVGKATFTVSGGLRPVRVSPSAVRIAGASLTGSGAAFHLVARATGSQGRKATLQLRRRPKPTTTTTPATTTTSTPPPTTTTTTTTTATPVRGAAAAAGPAAYAVPAAAVTVSTSAALASELAKPAHDIVLADGEYSSASRFSNPNGNRVYAAHLGGAVLHAGFRMGGNNGSGGGLIQGLVFDVSSNSSVEDNAIIDNWGAAGVNTTVLDTTFDGHGVIGYAIRVTTPEGFTARRIVARNLTNNGITVDSYPTAITFVRAPVLADLDVANVSRPTPKSSNGTSEACIWLGTKVTLTRAKLRNCAWMGLWTGFNGVGSTYSDLDVDATPTGIYMEHFTTSSTFRNLRIGSGVRTGVNCEWADPAWDGKPASVDNVIEDSLIESSWVGVYLDEGTTRTSVRNTTFRGQAGAAIDDYKGIGNSYTGNSYGPGTAISTAHL